MNNGAIKYICFVFFGLYLNAPSYGQVNSPARHEIDVKYAEMNLYNDYSSPEIILRAREFIRLDPAYYIGYMLEGFSRYDRSGDIQGYKLAIAPIKKAMDLLEKDYGSELKSVYSSRENFERNRDLLFNYVYITSRLMDCYSNIEHPDSVILLLDRYKAWSFEHDVLGADNYIAWTYHRNRFYTSQKFSFLKNSIAENEQIALNYLKQNLKNINEKAQQNETVIPYWMVLSAKMSVYHYLAIIYSYLHKPDSAKMYYEYMEPYNIFPYNNYAIFCFVNGNFETAKDYFSYSAMMERYDKYRLNESVYYLSIMNVMAADPQTSVSSMTSLINKNGVRPGWGWYNLALGRAMLYNGQIDSSMICINKASKFKEIHLGTTWGESHYLFSCTILKLMNIERQAAAIRFENKNYRFSPSKLKRLIELKIEEYSTKMALFNQLSSNPEREEIFYRLFASEATVSFDEVYHMIKDYGRNFFIKKFEYLGQNDERENIRKYFKLLQGKLYLEKKSCRKALSILKDLLDNHKSEKDYEILFKARLYEALALASKESGSQADYEKYRNSFYVSFPQLVPYSNIRMKFVLDVRDNNIKSADPILDEMKSFNIDFVTNSKEDLPKIVLQFFNNGVKDAVTYSVESAWRRIIIEPKTIIYDSPEGIGKKLAYSVFNAGAKGGDVHDYIY